MMLLSFLLQAYLPLVMSMVDSLHARYPEATLQDVYKTCYQDHFGAEHMAPDSASVARYLDYELSQMVHEAPSAMPILEPCGFRHRFVRMSLQGILQGDYTSEDVLRRFMEASSHCASPQSDWLVEWQVIDSVAVSRVPMWNDSTLRQQLRDAAAKKAAVHHSPAFRAAYRPHYRIVFKGT